LEEKRGFDTKNWKMIGNLGNLITPLEKLAHKWAKLEKLELEILRKSHTGLWKIRLAQAPMQLVSTLVGFLGCACKETRVMNPICAGGCTKVANISTDCLGKLKRICSFWAVV
jgi:hypothetical protein